MISEFQSKIESLEEQWQIDIENHQLEQQKLHQQLKNQEENFQQQMQQQPNQTRYTLLYPNSPISALKSRLQLAKSCKSYTAFVRKLVTNVFKPEKIYYHNLKGGMSKINLNSRNKL